MWLILLAVALGQVGDYSKVCTPQGCGYYWTDINGARWFSALGANEMPPAPPLARILTQPVYRPSLVKPTPQAPVVNPIPAPVNREPVPDLNRVVKTEGEVGIGALPPGQAAAPAAKAVLHSPDEAATNLPPGNTPSNVVTSKGDRLPVYATSGSLWKPGSRPGYSESDHPAAIKFVQSLTGGPEGGEEPNFGAKQPDLKDDSAKFRVYLIGRDTEARQRAIEDFSDHGKLSFMHGKVLVRSFTPDSWEAKDVGLTAKSDLDMIVQAPNGKVVRQLINYSPERAANALRKANPDFHPDDVPGVKPDHLSQYGITDAHVKFGLIAAGVVGLILLTTKPGAQS